MRAPLALNQPNGPQIPENGDLQALFDQAQDPISAVADAADAPETFSPTCNLTFTLLSRGSAAFQNVFGWYNVTGQAPPNSDLHVLISCNAQPPQSFPLAIKNDPSYLGGKVGFFLITPEGKPSLCASVDNIGHVYYSERGYNPDNVGVDSYIHLLIFDSKKIAKSFYFAWEDLFGGGDNNFVDLVARVDGVSCANGGASCQTGKLGVCGYGTMQCQNGMLTCLQSVQPGPESCDAVDNDCNGAVDDGMGLCPDGQGCDHGVCVPKCSSGEFTCPPNQVCSMDGLCVEPACVGVTCPDAQKCVAGGCVDPCGGVVCPHAQTCVFGVCIDPCQGIACDMGQVCVAGACIESCACAGCGPMQTCQPDGRCLEDACVGKSCPAGQYCAAGACVDACSGVQCPAGEACATGACAPSDMSAASSAASSSGNFVGSGGGGGASSVAASSGAGGSGMGGAPGISRVPARDVAKPSSCACHVGSADEATLGGAASLALLGLALRRRSKRR